MLRTILPDEMKRVERHFMEATGTPSLELMERAASHVADAALPYLRGGGGLLAACGAGNNGGDGLAAARLLMDRLPELSVTVWKLAGKPSVDTAVQREKLSAYAERVRTVDLTDDAPEVPAGTACVIDAMFGTGLNRPLEGAARAAAEHINASGAPVAAVDIPSGLNGVTGYPPGGDGDAAVVRAAATVTFHRPKAGLYLGDGPDVCGRVTVADIGIDPAWDDAPGMAVLETGDRLLPPRKRNTHKGTYGRLLVLAGSAGMAGAAGICATAALRAGAGLVTVACPREIVPAVQALCPCATCLPLPERDVEAAWQTLQPALIRADALVAGCGMGREALAVGLAERLLPSLCEHGLPAVLDADALNLLSKREDFRIGEGGLRFPDYVILTPHLGEAARLLHMPVDLVNRDQPAAARTLRALYGGAVVLKSAASVLMAADGEALNVFGTPAMAKGGSGDSLAGVLGALLAGRKAYGLGGVRLLQVACALHGLAGMAAAAEYGERGMLVTDLCGKLGSVPNDVPPPARCVCGSLYGAGPTGNPRAALGRRVCVTVDRPIGSRHPEHEEIIYPLNYGYVPNVPAADGEWQDAYIWGVAKPIASFEGEVAAVIRRLDDAEDKWVVAPAGDRPTAEEIRAGTAFAERYFQTEILL